VNVVVLDMDGALQVDPAASGSYERVNGVGIGLYKEEMETQRKMGWDHAWSWDSQARQ
jgi:hypothetical protein